MLLIPASAWDIDSFETAPGAVILVGAVPVGGDQLSLFSSWLLEQQGLHQFSCIFWDRAMLKFGDLVMQIPWSPSSMHVKS